MFDCIFHILSRVSPLLRSIRMDVVSMDDENILYNTEMQDKRKNDYASIQSKESQRLYDYAKSQSRIYRFSGVYVLDLAVWR